MIGDSKIGKAINRAKLALARLVNTRGSYRAALLENLNGEVVLADLYDYCGAGKSPASPGATPLDVGRGIGRLEVWLHVQQVLRLSDEAIARLRHKINQDEDTDHVT